MREEFDSMTSEDLLNSVLQTCEHNGNIGDPNLKRRIEMHLSGMASESIDAELRDFDERSLHGIPVHLDTELDWTVNVSISRSFCKGAPHPTPTASVSFVNNGTDYTLVGFPYESLRRIARFIIESVDEYEKADMGE